MRICQMTGSLPCAARGGRSGRCDPDAITWVEVGNTRGEMARREEEEVRRSDDVGGEGRECEKRCLVRSEERGQGQREVPRECEGKGAGAVEELHPSSLVASPLAVS